MIEEMCLLSTRRSEWTNHNHQIIESWANSKRIRYIICYSSSAGEFMRCFKTILSLVVYLICRIDTPSFVLLRLYIASSQTFFSGTGLVRTLQIWRQEVLTHLNKTLLRFDNGQYWRPGCGLNAPPEWKLEMLYEARPLTVAEPWSSRVSTRIFKWQAVDKRRSYVSTEEGNTCPQSETLRGSSILASVFLAACRLKVMHLRQLIADDLRSTRYAT